jgi:hypothetical protein
VLEAIWDGDAEAGGRISAVGEGMAGVAAGEQRDG